MIWTKPHISKIYEAAGAIGDNRIEVSDSENSAKMFSSSKGKFYTVTWNDDLSQMMSNDNSAYWTGQVSYPMISILMLKGKIQFDPKICDLLKGFAWKDINQTPYKLRGKNDFDKTVEFVLNELENRGEDVEFVKSETQNIADQLDSLQIEHLGNRLKPPKGY